MSVLCTRVFAVMALPDSMARSSVEVTVAISSPYYALVKIDGQVPRLLQSGKGIKLSSADLELLAYIGLLVEAKSSALEPGLLDRRVRRTLPRVEIERNSRCPPPPDKVQQRHPRLQHRYG